MFLLDLRKVQSCLVRDPATASSQALCASVNAFG